MKDRRKKSRNTDDRRYNNRVYTDIDVITFIENQEFHTKMRNISGNGMQIIEPAEIEMQPKQNCQITIKDEATMITLDAYVVWKDFGLIGLCFEKQNQKNQKRINKLSQKLLMVSLTDEGVAGLV
ncbi:MAG: PilZ domain-containing protein [Proteobacteria bacterium]|nr:PilZ domain-containing protein [Pseudomonadota bacterium]NOG60158.1 PilZ domain-containing protein [Pseudomonadota bacterium]